MVAILTILASVIVPFVVGKRQASWANDEPAGPPRVSRHQPVFTDNIKLFVADKVMAAEVSQVLSNGGFQVQWFDDKTGTILR